MKIEVLKENLKANLNIAERIVSKNLSLPILNNVSIHTDDHFLSLISTDLEIAIRDRRIEGAGSWEEGIVRGA